MNETKRTSPITQGTPLSFHDARGESNRPPKNVLLALGSLSFMASGATFYTAAQIILATKTRTLKNPVALFILGHTVSGAALGAVAYYEALADNPVSTRPVK